MPTRESSPEATEKRSVFKRKKAHTTAPATVENRLGSRYKMGDGQRDFFIKFRTRDEAGRVRPLTAEEVIREKLAANVEELATIDDVNKTGGIVPKTYIVYKKQPDGSIQYGLASQVVNGFTLFRDAAGIAVENLNRFDQGIFRNHQLNGKPIAGLWENAFVKDFAFNPDWIGHAWNNLGLVDRGDHHELVSIDQGEAHTDITLKKDGKLAKAAKKAVGKTSKSDFKYNAENIEQGYLLNAYGSMTEGRANLHLTDVFGHLTIDDRIESLYRIARLSDAQIHAAIYAANIPTELDVDQDTYLDVKVIQKEMYQQYISRRNEFARIYNKEIEQHKDELQGTHRPVDQYPGKIKLSKSTGASSRQKTDYFSLAEVPLNFTQATVLRPLNKAGDDKGFTFTGAQASDGNAQPDRYVKNRKAHPRHGQSGQRTGTSTASSDSDNSAGNISSTGNSPLHSSGSESSANNSPLRSSSSESSANNSPQSSPPASPSRQSSSDEPARRPSTEQQPAAPKLPSKGAAIALMVTGVLLSLTLVGALVGLPLLALGAYKMHKHNQAAQHAYQPVSQQEEATNRKAQKPEEIMKGDSPYSHSQLQKPEGTSADQRQEQHEEVQAQIAKLKKAQPSTAANESKVGKPNPTTTQQSAPPPTRFGCR